MDPAKPVRQIGNYEVLSEIKRGGMGVIYRAKDKYIRREVAIKQMLQADDDARRRFFEEAESSGSLNHPNIVTIFGFDQQDGDPYLVMEFINGQSLEEAIESPTPPSLVEGLDIVRQVCEGLGYAHRNGVVHRDIKPANIMVQPEGAVKIVDFGIARLKNASGHTGTGNVVGTVHYISPERLKGQKTEDRGKGEPADGRADIWATGVVLYRMLTGRLPFPGDNMTAMHRIVSDPYEPLSKYLRNYPPALDALLERSLAKNPEDRYSTCEEMAYDVSAIIDPLKKMRVGEVLSQAKSYMEREELTRARSSLLEVLKLEPQNTEVKRLLREAQDKLTRQQKSEQLRQLIQQAEDAVRERKFGEALDIYQQAEKVDPTNRGLTGKLQQIRELKEKADRVEFLKQQAREARHRNDFRDAAKLIGEAIELDTGNTDLRNEQARILQEEDRLAKASMRGKLKNAARDNLAGRQYTEAVKVLRQAFELDPTDAEAQAMLQDAVAKQEEERRRKIIDQIVVGIQDQIFRGQLERALDSIDRALEQLPGEGVLLRLKAETQKKHADAVAQKLLEETSVRVQSLILSSPQEALAVVQRALEIAPGEPGLLSLQQRVVDQLKRSNLEALRSQYLKQAQAAVANRDFGQAIQVLETALLDCGDGPEIQSLLQYAREEKASAERREAAANVIRDAQQSIGAGDLEGAIALLRRGAQETGDTAVQQLLRQTQDRFDEVGRRVQDVVSRIQALSESDPVQALELLRKQPVAIQQHPAMKSLLTRLDARSQREQATRDAVARAAEQLRQGQLREGLETLEAVRQAFGDFPQIANAIADYQAKRAPLANANLTAAMKNARQAVLSQQSTQALEILRTSRPSVEFAEPGLQEDWKRLAEEVTKAANVKRGSTDELVIVKGGKISPKLIMAIAAVVVLAIVGAVVMLRPKPQIVTTDLELNASPYAEVVSVTPEKGAAISLPPGDHWTPMRIDGVPAGTYSVLFRSGGTELTATCVVSSENHLCAPRQPGLSEDDISAIIGAGGGK